MDEAATVEARLVLDAEPSEEPGLPNDRSNRLGLGDREVLGPHPGYSPEGGGDDAGASRCGGVVGWSD